MAMSTLAVCVLSSFSKYTRLPAGSTTATAMAQLFLRASAVAAAAAFFAVSRLMGIPYGVGGGAVAGAWAIASALTRIRLSIVSSDRGFSLDSGLWILSLYRRAIQSISTETSRGRRDTSTVARAGGTAPKNSPYVAFISAKSFMSFRNTVVFTTFSS